MLIKTELSPKLEYKNSDYAFNKSDSNMICGYASVFGVVDDQQDIVLQGAFGQSLLAHLTNRKIALLWQHMSDKPIGVIEQLLEDEYGLYIKARILDDIRYGQEALSLIRSQAVCGLSIGFSPTKYHYRADNVRVLEEVSLWEVSVVTFPANRFASVAQLEKQCKKTQLLILRLGRAINAVKARVNTN